eukprot:scaffold10007_cov49-Cylindrotheca_fusiformis.AAC.1
MANDCITFFLAACFSIVVIAIAWFAYRPLLSVVLLLLVGAATYFMRQRQQKKHSIVIEEQTFEVPGAQPFKDDAGDTM